MKTLLLITIGSGLAFSAGAQQDIANHYNRNDSRPSLKSHINPKENDRRDLKNRLVWINNDYDNRINMLRHQPFMRIKERNKQIKQLQKERTVALQQCRNSYSIPFASGYDHHPVFNDHR